MSANEVERLHDGFLNLRGFLTDNTGGLTLLSVVDETFPKTLLLAVASHFEHRMTRAVEKFARQVTRDDDRLVSLIQKKVIGREYFKWFDWEGKNANSFFGMFDPSFQTQAKGAVKKNERLKTSIEVFLTIGDQRNRLVHQDFASYALPWTPDEIYEKYRSATIFVDWFPNAIRNFSTPKQQPSG